VLRSRCWILRSTIAVQPCVVYGNLWSQRSLVGRRYRMRVITHPWKSEKSPDKTKKSSRHLGPNDWRGGWPGHIGCRSHAETVGGQRNQGNQAAEEEQIPLAAPSEEGAMESRQSLEGIGSFHVGSRNVGSNERIRSRHKHLARMRTDASWAESYRRSRPGR
jgi:hypothetical protein